MIELKRKKQVWTHNIYNETKIYDNFNPNTYKAYIASNSNFPKLWYFKIWLFHLASECKDKNIRKIGVEPSVQFDEKKGGSGEGQK